MTKITQYKKHNLHSAIGLIVLVVCICALMLLIYPKADKSHRVENGTLDLASYDPLNGDMIKLNGEWAFVYNQFSLNRSEDMILVEVPSTWNSYRIDDVVLNDTGYCTYRLRVTNCEPNENLAISIQTIPSAYAVYINDKRVGGRGSVGQSIDEEIPKMQNELIFFIAPEEDFDINIQVSNFHYAKGGLWSDIHLGSSNKTVGYSNFLIGKDLFIMGILFIIAVLYGLFYFYEQRHKKYILFAICCLLTIVLIDMGRNMLILSLLPNSNSVFLTKVCNILTGWLPIVIVLYTRSLLTIQKYKTDLIIFVSLIIIQSILEFVFPPYNTKLALSNNILSAVALMYCIFMAISSLKTHFKTAFLFIQGFAIVGIGFVYDYILLYPNVVDLGIGSLLPICVAILMIYQAYALTVDYNELQIKRQEAVKQTAQAKLAFLQAQIKPHFLYNALSAIEDLCCIDGKKASELITDLTFYLRSSFEFNNLNRFTTLSHELEFINNYVHIQEARFGDKISYSYQIHVSMDTTLPILILEPLVENAIQHGIRGKDTLGNVILNVSACENGTLFKVIDDGVGIPSDIVDAIIKDEYHSKGIGLMNINKRLKEMYGDKVCLRIHSEEGNGTEISFTIPGDEEL